MTSYGEERAWLGSMNLDRYFHGGLPVNYVGSYIKAATAGVYTQKQILLIWFHAHEDASKAKGERFV